MLYFIINITFSCHKIWRKKFFDCVYKGATSSSFDQLCRSTKAFEMMRYFVLTIVIFIVCSSLCCAQEWWRRFDATRFGVCTDADMNGQCVYYHFLPNQQCINLTPNDAASSIDPIRNCVRASTQTETARAEAKQFIMEATNSFIWAMILIMLYRQLDIAMKMTCVTMTVLI